MNTQDISHCFNETIDRRGSNFIEVGRCEYDAFKRTGSGGSAAHVGC